MAKYFWQSFVVVIIFLWTTSSAHNAKCPLKESTLKLNVTRFSGLWFVGASYPYFVLPDQKCQFIEIVERGTNGFIFNSVQYNTTTNLQTSLKAFFNVGQTSESQQLTELLTQPKKLDVSNFRILKVNYNYYALVNACVFNDGIFEGHLVWILTRVQHPGINVWLSALHALREFGFSTDKIKRINQSTCVDVAQIQGSSENFPPTGYQ